MKFLDFITPSPKAWRWWALAVLLLASVFRLILLHDVPPGLAQDEVLNADIVTFIRQGQHALFFREGYGHEPLYHYWSVPFQVLFGDNVLSIRLPAVYLGMLLVALTMRWARREFSGVTAVTAGFGLAISWWPIIFSRIGLRPILEPLLLVAAAWFWRRPWLAGLFLGLSLYSYTGARVVFLIPLLWGIVQVWAVPDQSKRRDRLRTAVIILTVSLIVSLPLYWTLQADPSLQQRVDQLAGPLEALRQGDSGPIWQMTLATLGVFSFAGDPRWTYSLPGRPFFDWVTAVFFYAGFLLALYRWRQPRYTLILVWLAVTLLPSAITPQAPSTVRLVGAMPVVYLLVGTAVAAFIRWVQAARPTVKRYVWPGTAVFLLAVGLVNVFRTVNDGFIRWPAALETRLKYQTVLLDMARHWQAEQTENWVVAESFFEPIDADSLRRNLGASTKVRWIQTGPDIAGAIIFPAEAGAGRLYVPEFAAISADLLAVAGVAERPLFRSLDHPSFAVYDLPARPPIAPLVEPLVLEGAVTFLGYEILPATSERPLQLFSYWRVETALPDDLTTFAHLLSADGSIFAQYDGLDAVPLTLQPGDLFVQRHILPSPEITAGQSFTLQLGLYTRGNGRRLFDGNGRDTIILRENWALTEIE
jgi:4-amino-4-deoxy-L-arabinose transferase-like glycosyltransferase